MLLSSKGYGVLWNNYGLTEYNPCGSQLKLERQQGEGKAEVVNVTSTEGGKQEIRKRHRFVATLDVKAEGDYALLLDVGQQMECDGYYIPGTDWIDFFNPSAANAYWRHFKERLLPLGIDAWWQDATEPENDDLLGRCVNNGKWSGEQVRNVYPLLVCKTVYEGLVDAGKEPMILTRSGFPGVQRYGVALWSGMVQRPNRLLLSV